ncbi:inter-alpha-trypsin inhibitor heavy chain H2 [Etheostoma cragini]|uniref:inter-alpha-trypsin inhibitor heavy chain H2 n=1 Tax=Etheostoma cragini TaxID=417921 RepID=UPI00155EBEE4|nr:inter-alpha-trypsin inhibitor heavy chain H2 [Etheostoma cragini]XP_034719360.1 inter-alpha-trypsin inhibitor heavy chain H2 [Etheostoma cragini]
MRRLLLLLLPGLLLLQQGRCFEFVIDGEWEEESSDIREHRERHKRAILTSEEQEDFEAIRGDDITIKSYKLESRITSRFAHTTVRSSVVNSGSKAQSIGFNVQIPKRAFITNFTMNVNGITFVGSVKEKTVARNLYAQARAKGKAAGIVRANSQDMETFKTEVHVPPGSNIEFELHYQEMMYRKLGFYEHSLYLQPGRLVPQFQVDVYIFEPKGISTVQTPNSLGEQFTEMIKVTSSKEKAHVVFKPNIQQQRKCDNCTESAIDGVFTVMYDVTRDSNAGELQVSDGHFVQFFAPSNLSPLPKNIVFVLDVSGSMWGVKMKQTVEAMQAILDDLTIDDHFSLIDFNHNVRCWSEELVPGSSIQIGDAKKYIQNIKPNGGTNINEALMRAVQMLLRASSQGLIDPRSVSMIILVSDGDPTVGEIKLSTIQKNVKRVMREEFSLFSLGIGFDVDYDFLERIAMENRGMAQRIYANHDAAEQLRTFYSQVSSPLLRRIAIQFPEDSVSDVTQNRFDKFFSGSELVVAGKVLPSDSNTLTSFTTASAARLDITLETEGDHTELDTELAKQQHSFTGFARQMWAYITIKQLFSERSQAPTAAKKRKITQRIMSLAVEHQFVTPLTALLVESEDAKERLLADSPKDPKHGCCSGVGIGGSPNGVTPVHVVYQPPPWVQMTTTPPPSQAAKGPEEWTLPQQVNLVDNDPHFIVHLPRHNMDVCFNIDSTPGHILNLVSDSGTGVVVNGQLIGSKQIQKSKLKTYFGTISVYYLPDGVSVTIGTDSIALTDGRMNHSFTWGATAEITQDGVRISIVKNSHVSIIINNNIQVMVLLHRVWKKHPVNVDFLGIYIPNDNQYSPLVHGLIGQFSREPEVSLYDVHEGIDPLKKEATMDVKGNKLLVTRGWQKDYRHDKRRGSNVYCWFIHNSGKGFIDGHYTDYIVPNLNSFLQTL